MSSTNKDKLFTEGILIAALPIIAYWVTYLYEKSYFAVYGIPDYLINITFNDILWVFIQLGFFLMLIMATANHVLVLVGLPKDYSQLLFYITSIIFFIQFLLYYPNHLYKLRYSYIPILIFLFAGYILPWLIKVFAKNSSVAERKKDTNFPKPGIMDLLVYRFGYGIPVLWLILLILWQLATLIGDGMALRRMDYLVINTEPKMAVIKTYNDNFICSQVNIEAKEIQKSFILIPTAELKNTQIELQTIGPLTIVD